MPNTLYFFYKDEVGYNQKLNVITTDNLSTNSYSTPVPNSFQSSRGNFGNQSFNNKVKHLYILSIKLKF